MNRVVLFLMLLVVVAGIFLRFDRLAAKPFHHDESVNYSFVAKLVEDGVYRYNPENFHGPILFEAAYFPVRFFGAGEKILRAMPAFLGSLVVLLILLMVRDLGVPGAIFAAAACALSPAGVYFSRTFIHEIYLVFALALFSWLFLRYLSRPTTRTLIGAMAALTLAFASKETAALSVATLIIAFGAAVFLGRESPGELSFRPWRHTSKFAIHCVDAGIISVFVWMLLFSTFTTNPGGMKDFFHAFTRWFETGVSKSGHEKPFWYFFGLLGEYYWPVAIAALPGVAGLIRRRPVEIFFFTWFCGHLLIYSIIPYKTPWCLITLAFPLVIFSGFGVTRLWQWSNARPLVRLLTGVVLVGGLLFQLRFSLELNFRYFDDDRHKIVYVQTRRMYLEMLPKVAAAAEKVKGAGTEILMVDTKHPTLFYFRDYYNQRYHASAPKAPITTPIILASEAAAGDVRAHLDSTYVESLYPMWPGENIVLFLRAELWEEHPDKQEAL